MPRSAWKIDFVRAAAPRRVTACAARPRPGRCADGPRSPSRDPAGAAVADGAQVQPALPGGQVGDVGGPDPVQLAVVEAAPDQVRRPAAGPARPEVVTGMKPRGLIPTIPACRISFATVLRRHLLPGLAQVGQDPRRPVHLVGGDVDG